MGFPNKAGDHADTDDILTAELEAAGIDVIKEELLRKLSGEVKTAVRGTLHGWHFTRAWYYWMCEGPGIKVEAAERLHASHGKTVRVAGDCGCPSPREVFKGLACGSYHVDDAEGLKALADTIKDLVDSPRCDVDVKRGWAELSKDSIDYPRDIFMALIHGNSPYAFYLFQWVPYQTDAKKWRLKMQHDVKTFDGREAHGIWPNGNHCGPFTDDEVEFIRISKDQCGTLYVDPRKPVQTVEVPDAKN